MNIKQYLDSTYLKTPEQSGLTEAETWIKVKDLIDEAIEHEIFAVMIRPNLVKKAKKHIEENNAHVVLGTVISFHEGNNSVADKLSEAQKAITDGADELDFVISYEAFKNGNVQSVADEVKACNELVLKERKVIKWIIEAAALNDEEIANITNLIKTVTENNFEGQEENVFVKSSTGFFQTTDGSPNGATEHNIKIMLENAGKLPVKAAGGVRSYEDAIKMVKNGVKRIGTSSALAIANGKETNDGY